MDQIMKYIEKKWCLWSSLKDKNKIHITVPDTYAESHLHDTACRPGAAADKAAAKKSSKYHDFAGTHLFFPVAIETAGTWNQMAVELVQEIGRWITLVTEDTRESVFVPAPVNCPSTGKCGLLPQHFHHRVNAAVVLLA